MVWQSEQFAVSSGGSPLPTGGAPSFSAAGVQIAAGEHALDGNGVALDEQLAKVADTDATHELVTDLYAKYLSMFRTALGR